MSHNPAAHHAAALPLAPPPRNLVEAMRHHARRQPERRAITFLEDGIHVSRALTHGALDQAVRAFAARLQAEGFAGQRALLVFEPGLDFVIALHACLAARVVPVPACPLEAHRQADAIARVDAIVDDARPALVLASSRGRALAEALLGESTRSRLSALPWRAPDDAGAHTADDWTMPSLADDTLAFLQYTSGSTARPRGVMITHGGLMANLRMAAEAYGLSGASVLVSWLPLSHDMGLIGHVLFPLALGAQTWLMPPSVFLRTPVRWLNLIDRVRATATAAPNFAFDLAVRRTSAAERALLDLSSLEVIVNGAEPVRPGTVDRFDRAFAPAGLRPSVLAPSYGLAEVGLFACSPRPARRGARLRLVPAALELHRVEIAAPAETAVSVTSCGQPWGGRVVIVDPRTRRPTAPGTVGEIWLAGPHVAAGYWRRPEDTAETFVARLAGAEAEGAFLRTGDLGFLHEGELYVTGRRKDVIRVRGRNLYPQDVERTLDAARARHPEIRAGGSAALGVDVDGVERLVVFQEVDPARAEAFDPAQTIAALRAAVTEAHGVDVHGVVLLAPGGLPKTSSGKVMRFACRAAFIRDFCDTALPVLTRDLRLVPRRPIATARPDAEAARLQDWIIHQLARALDTSPGALAARLTPGPRGPVRLSALGVDSLAALHLLDALEARLGRELPASLLQTHQDLGSLTAWLLDEAV